MRETADPAGGMRRALIRAIGVVDRIGLFFAALGAALTLAQAVWISFGVVMRYVFRSPDRMVTEATALLLFPVAFAGLAYALREDAYPRVPFIVGRLPERARKIADLCGAAIIFAVAAFFAIAAGEAALRDWQSGAASEILLWPRVYFWTPAAAALALLTVRAALRFAEIALDMNRRHA